MDKNEIIQILEDDYGTSDPNEISESERRQLFERLKFSLQMSFCNAEDYTKGIVIMYETLEL